MVEVRGGMKSRDKVKSNSGEYQQYLATLNHQGIMMFCSTVSKLESGGFIVLLTAIARQCTVYRTVFLKNKINEYEADKLLLRWTKKLPVKYIK